MKNYSQLLKELPSKTVVFAFGRFNPPTIGHELLVKAVRKLAQQRKADHVIYASASQDAKKNPLDVGKKIHYLQIMFPNTNFLPAGGDARTFLEAAKVLNKRYKNIIMIAGSDRVPEFKRLLNTYNGKEFHFDTIEVVSAGDRDPDADDATGMSASKMRAIAAKGNYLEFKRGLPTTIRDIDGRRLMNDIRAGLGLEVVKEQLNLVKDQLREKYFRGDIYKLDDIVESGDEVFKIVKRGSNHLLLQDSTGNLVSKWIQDVSETEKAYMLQEDLTDKTLKTNDKIKVARIIATMLGIDNAESLSNPEALVNLALRKSRQKALNPEALKIVAKMLALATEVGINYDENLKPQKLKETVTQAITVDDSLEKKKKKIVKEDSDAVTQLSASAKQAARQTKYADLAMKQAKAKETLAKQQKKEQDQLRDQISIRESDSVVVDKNSNYNLAKSVMRYSDFKKTIGQAPIEIATPAGQTKETESDYDAMVGNTAHPHSRVGHSLQHDDNHHVRRQKVKYHLGEARGSADKHYAIAQDHKEKASLATKGTEKYHAHMADHHDSMSRYHEELGQSNHAESHAEKAETHHEKAFEASKNVKEEYCATEYASGKIEVSTPTPQTAIEDEDPIDDHSEMTDAEIELEIEKMSEDEYLEAYEDDELAVVDAETGEEIPNDPEIQESVELMEVLSRMERIRAKTRFSKTKAKRERSEKIALKKYSDVKTINKRARRLAIKLMKKRMLRGRNPNNLSVPEKERMERMIQKRSAVVGRVASRLTGRIRKLEKSRLSHTKFTAGAAPTVF